MLDNEIQSIIQKIDDENFDREQMLQQVVATACSIFFTSDLKPQEIADQILKITQSVTIKHNANLKESTKLKIPKQIEPTQLALYLFASIPNINDVMRNDIEFMRLIWLYAIGYSKHDIKCVQNEILRLQGNIKPDGKE